MATQSPAGAAWPQIVEQLASTLAASNTAIECTFDQLEVVLPRDDASGAPPPRCWLNGTIRLRVSAERPGGVPNG